MHSPIPSLSRFLGIPPRSKYRLTTRQIRTIDQFLEPLRPLFTGKAQTSSLDLGCGPHPRNPFNCKVLKGIDIAPHDNPGVMQLDLFTSRIPFPDATFDSVTAFDFIEHVPRQSCIDGKTQFPFVNLMSDIFRVLKPGGIFFSKTPAYPFPEAFIDPTHVNIITEKTWSAYFCQDGTHPLAKMYGFNGEFTLLRQAWWGGAWIIAALQKPSA